MSFIDEVTRAVGDGFQKMKAVFTSYLEGEVVESLRVEFEAGTQLPPLGILRDMGYRAGKSGLIPRDRREILRRTFRLQLVATSPWTTEYIREWGDRCSPARLEKMTRVLGGLAANARRKTKVDMSEAIRDWQEDQNWLESKRLEWLDHTH